MAARALPMPVRLAAVLLAATLAQLAWADLVYLTNGRVLEGRVREENGKVIIERPDGTITIPAERVERIERQPSVLDEYEQRAALIDVKAAGAAQRFVELGRWCAERRMNNAERQCYRRAVELDPDCAVARIALGFVKYDGAWLTQEEFQQARGLVRYGEAWVTPEARADLARLEAQRKLEQTRAETERARADRAQADADRARAEAEAARAPSWSGAYAPAWSPPVYVSSWPGTYWVTGFGRAGGRDEWRHGGRGMGEPPGHRGHGPERDSGPPRQGRPPQALGNWSTSIWPVWSSSSSIYPVRDFSGTVRYVPNYQAPRGLAVQTLGWPTSRW